MAFVTLYRDKLHHNFHYLDRLFKENGIKWGITTKLLCGHEEYLKEVIDLGIREMHDSRISNLQAIKEIDPGTMTVYIKPPPLDIIPDVVRYADVSLNTELATLQALSLEAVRQQRIHKVVIMIEMGDLREGVMREDLLEFYGSVFDLPGIEVIGLGTNLSCLHGVLPNSDKLIQLALYKQIIELRFNRSIPLISGGTSVTIPLLLNGEMPAGVNHFRVGEALFFGKNLFTGETIEGMHDGVLELSATIVELSEKPMVPMGELGVNSQGKVSQVREEDMGRMAWRAILDIGYLDVQPEFLIPSDPEIEIVDASSDMLVLNLGSHPGQYKVGDTIRFRLHYTGALRLMNSDYIEKITQ